ncbi:hypothetical protein HAX54_020222 [Datura stramonium]|uniref:Uncharacterized protein n=1 Tax=Datura stramonium TaxID=4076 RepID=A0ABS8UTJ5_DATST|nr:hypothetical protein [Datura stramonium]
MFLIPIIRFCLSGRAWDTMIQNKTAFTTKKDYGRGWARAEVARLRELHTLKGHVESVVKLKGLDIETIQQHYTV